MSIGDGLYEGGRAMSENTELRSRVAELERQIADVRRYLIPMQTWPDLDEHARGHVAMMLHVTKGVGDE